MNPARLCLHQFGFCGLALGGCPLANFDPFWEGASSRFILDVLPLDVSWVSFEWGSLMASANGHHGFTFGCSSVLDFILLLVQIMGQFCSSRWIARSSRLHAKVTSFLQVWARIAGAWAKPVHTIRCLAPISYIELNSVYSHRLLVSLLD